MDMKTSSMQYFGSIQTLIKELRSKDFQAMTTYSKFFDKYARQIDNLSVLNVDPVVLSYGTYVADSFREVSGGLLDVNLQKVEIDKPTKLALKPTTAEAITRTITGTPVVMVGAPVVTARICETDSESLAKQSWRAKSVPRTLREVDAQTAEVKRQMSEKYNVDF